MTDEVRDFIKAFHMENDYMPTLQEIADHFSDGLEKRHARQWAFHYVQLLKKQKRIKVQAFKNRGIELV